MISYKSQIMKIITKILFILFPCLIVSCSPSYRLNRLLALHPELKIPDTLFIRDSLIVPQVQVDTMLEFKTIRDTVVIHKDRLQIKLSKIHDTLFLTGKCKSDTVYITRKILIEKIKTVKPSYINYLFNIVRWLVIFGILFIIIYSFLRFFKK